MDDDRERGPIPEQAAKPPADGKAAPPPRRRPDRPFIPFARYEDVVARCGHVEKFGLLPDNKDRFREARRKKATDRDCTECRQRRHREEVEAAQLRRAQKEERKARQAEQPPRPQKQPRLLGRLPDGSRFDVRYDAARQEWTGSLTIPTAEGEATFTGSASGLFPLLSSLDRQYRATLG